MEQIEFLAKLAVVAGLGLLEKLQMLLQFALLGERHTVHPRQLLLGFVPFPVRTRNGHDFGRLDEACVRDVRPPAEVGEFSLGVERDGPVFEALQQIELVFVALLCEVGQRLRLRHVLAHKGVLGLGQFHHFLLHRRDVLVREGVFPEVHVVVETVLHRRTDPKFDAGIQRFQRFSHEVGRAVPQGVHALLVARGQQLQGAIAGQRPLRVPHFAVHFGREHVSGQAFADGHGHVQGSGPF